MLSFIVKLLVVIHCHVQVNKRSISPLVTERGSQGQIPLQEGTAAVCRAQWRRDRRQRFYHQGTVPEIRKRY